MSIKTFGPPVIINGEDYDAIIGGLRHLYENLVNGATRNPRGLADGLLSPAIKKLERAASGEP